MLAQPGDAQEARQTVKPVLHGKHWVAITGKPLAATAGALTFARGGNAVDAACAMLAAAATMWDTLSWGGETQALIFDPRSGKVRAINALGVAPTGATPEFYRSRGLHEPPDFGPLAAVTPGTPGGLMVMLAEFGTLSLAEVLEPALQMAAGYPMEQTQSANIEENKEIIARWDASRRVLLPHFNPGKSQQWAAPYPGEIFKQPELLATLQKLVEAERRALAAGRTRKEAILAAYDRFYRGDIGRELVAATQAAGGLITMEDLDRWQVHVEDPAVTQYRDIEVYKLNHWVQGPVLLQTLNILENVDLRSMGYNSARYIHTLYQAMNLAFADRDFYYGDPYVPPVEPIKGLLSKDYARTRLGEIDWRRNNPLLRPGDPYPFQGETNPYRELLERWRPRLGDPQRAALSEPRVMTDDEAFLAGTTSIQAADANGWVVSITPSGGWIPAFIAGSTGFGLSQRMQSFVMDEQMNPFNVLAPGKRPRATLSPSMAGARRQAVSIVCGPGWRCTGPESAPVLSQRRRVRDDRAAGGRSSKHQLLSNARIIRTTHLATRPPHRAQRHADVGARRARAHGLCNRSLGTHVRSHQRDLHRPRARVPLGRLQRLRRRLRRSLVDSISTNKNH